MERVQVCDLHRKKNQVYTSILSVEANAKDMYGFAVST